MAEKKSKAPSGHLWLTSYPKDIPWDATFEVAPLYKLIDDAAAAYPQRYCLNFLGKRYTYGEVHDLVNRAAKGLQELGVKPGVKVGLFMPNAPAYVIFYYAILKAGGIVVNFSPLYAPREISNQIVDSQTEIIVTLDLALLYDKVKDLVGETPLQKIIVCPLKDQLPFPKNYLFPLLKAKEVARIDWTRPPVFMKDIFNNDGSYEKIKVDPEKDVAVLQYTGGTTGVPKGAMLTHKNLFVNAQQADLWYVRETEAGTGEKILAALPLFHVFAMTAVMNIALRVGGEIVMMFPRFQVEEAMQLIAKHKITFFPAVPTIYTMIANHPKVRSFNLRSLKACLSGGAPLPVEVKKKFEELTGCQLVEAYGLSETSPAATCNPMYGVNKPASIGVPFPGTVVKIMSLDNPSDEVPQGEKGEICIQGPQVMTGYWKKPAETSRSLVGGLFYTGDVGYMDKEGYIFLVDRIKDVILCSGFNVYPRNVEEAIYLHSAVEECTVIGIPDEKRGETVKAFIKLREGTDLSAEALQDFLQDKLSPVEMPKQIEFRDALPKTMIGKLSKKELIEEERLKRAGTEQMSV
jgi:long-chain acyl-CoA synthetase